MADWLFFLYIGLLYLDWLTTMHGISIGASEKNDLMKFFFEKGFGWSLLFTFIATIPVFIFRERIDVWGWLILVGLPLALVLNNMAVIKEIEDKNGK